MREKFVLFKLIVGLFLAVFIAALAYGGYIYFSYDRIYDFETIKITGEVDKQTKLVKNDKVYTIGTYNIGFGCYVPEFSFVFDGGEKSRGESREKCNKTATAAAELAMKSNPDFMLFQEVDTDSTRSHNVNQDNLLTNVFNKYHKAFASNSDSSYILYPLQEPVGMTKSGMSTYSRYEMESAMRRSLPINPGFEKYIDLDRCYTYNKIPVSGGKSLIIYNIHLSAMGNDESTREKQLNSLYEDIENEIELGNYIIAGGDFNHNLRLSEDSKDEFKDWTYPFPKSKMPKGLRFAIDDLSKNVLDAMENTARDTVGPYSKETTKTYMTDGFMVSDNINVVDYEVIKSGFAYSDHQPVMMKFKLK